MKDEKRYPVIDEEDGSDLKAEEPAAAYVTKEVNPSGIAYIGDEAEKIDRTMTLKFSSSVWQRLRQTWTK